MLAIVLAGGAPHRHAGAEEPGADRHRRRWPSSRSSSSRVPFPLIVLGAGADRLARRPRRLRRCSGRRPRHGRARARPRRRRQRAGRRAAGARAAAVRHGRSRGRGVWLALWLGPGGRSSWLTLGPGERLRPDRDLLQPRWRWSPSAAPMRCWPMSRSRRSSTYHWLQPGEMLDGLGMAETTPGPLIMVTAVRGLHGAPSATPGALPPLLAGTLGGAAHHLGHLRALLPLDLPRRALHRAPARQPGARRRALRDHRRGGRRDPEPRGLVRAPHAVPRGAPGRRSGLAFDVPVLASVDPWALALSVAAGVAIFRFRIGMIPTLLACSWPAWPSASCSAATHEVGRTIGTWRMSEQSAGAQPATFWA